MAIDLIPALNISSSGLDAESARMDAVANNLANVNSTGGDNGDVYKRRIPVFNAVFNDQLNDKRPADELGGVKLEKMALDNKNPLTVYAPYHPNADAKGMVSMPNISPIEEMLDMITSTRAYEANLNVMNESKKMADKTVNLFK
ncbi:MAG: flagellar basal body rod protein FlgC [Lentisphaerae bacterium GWF2_44_16]|nr:MAG: flagellar basal body rod protein FlgC [Lentisphaerae bacterium GWF2_44_16]